jgi:hypothetical protein
MNVPIAVKPEKRGPTWKITVQASTHPHLSFISPGNTEQEAIGEVIDWLDSHLPILLLTANDLTEIPPRNLELYTVGGRTNRAIATSNLTVTSPFLTQADIDPNALRGKTPAKP